MKALATILILAGTTASLMAADAPATRTPPLGIEVPQEVRKELAKGVEDLDWELQDLKILLQKKPELAEFLPDVMIYERAVQSALDQNIFYKTNDFATARKLLAEGTERAHQLKEGKAPWNAATGLVVRGYVSKIDGSVQPYGLVVPVTYDSTQATKHRLDFWYHGRNAELSELAFIADRERNRGEFTPADTIVLHPYGRYCNANKFAGEVDSFEALDAARKHYPVDENRILVRGFSMGGAATWHMAVHHAGLWAAASPGAGFADTAIFQKIFSRTNVQPPPWYVQRLWHLYDATDYAGNLYSCPVVAYSGEIDPQREAAEMMTRAMRPEGLELMHIIGPKTAHKYEPKAKEEVAKLVDALAEKGRDSLPKKIRFTTWTLRYNQLAWVTVDGLGKHWNRARVDAEMAGSDRVNVMTTNVTALTLAMPAGLCPLSRRQAPTVTLDGQRLEGPTVATDLSWTAHFRKNGRRWAVVADTDDGKTAKRHGLQGPIDDAFMDSFIMVRPTGASMNAQVGAWATNAMAKAVEAWRLQFRGEPRVKDDTDLSDEDIAGSNLVLWGDPDSNVVLRRIMDKLPMKWTSGGVRYSGRYYSSKNCVPILIYPNPLNPKHYVVLNSGFTFAEAGVKSNALQVPQLPDFVVIDINAGNYVLDAGFFDEGWRFPIIQ